MNVELLRVIARLLSSDLAAGNRSCGRRGMPLFLGAVVTILLCALSRNAVFTITILAAALLRLSLMEAEAIRRALHATIAAAGMACIFMLPSVWLGSGGSFGTVVMKVTESVLVLSVLRELVSWKELTAAMGAFHLPEIFVLTLDMTVRFLVLLGRYSGEIAEAVTLRKVGKNDWRSAGTGGILGNTFLKARDLSVQTGEAMVCRGWDGHYAEWQETAGDDKKSLGRDKNGLENQKERWLLLAVTAALLAELVWFYTTQQMV